MGLFDKKYCDVCGEKIGLFGNRKLEDGNLCKDCASKLSRWFDDRRNSTVDEIRAQLDYRAVNLEKVKAFSATRSFGRNAKLLLDEDKQLFMVAFTSKLLDENPDVLDFSQVTGCDLTIDEDRDEEMRELEDGKEVSYNPPHYIWNYTFTMTIRVNHPYFDDMQFDLNSGSRLEIQPDYRNAFAARNFDPRKDARYLEYVKMGEEIKDALTSIRTEHREAVAAANAPKAPAVCTACGATSLPDANGCCEYCGTPLPKA
ncbi:MAG: DUF4428 domain-containing protein [Clostridiales bacterium]|nr:DUF4428 domain-containing protein [Clostridiales bacterium]